MEMYGNVIATGHNEDWQRLQQKSYPSFQMTATTKCSTEFAVAVLRGEATTLQDEHSEVSVDVPSGIKATLWQKVHTEFSRFLHIVPDNECFVGPVVELHLKPFAKEESEEQRYRIKIPYCLQAEEEMSLVKVRCGDIRRKIPFHELLNKKEASGKIPYYEVTEKHIIIHANHFTDHICSACKDTCFSFIMAFPFGSVLPGKDDDDTLATVEVYLCCSLYNIEDFQSVSFYLRNNNIKIYYDALTDNIFLSLVCLVLTSVSLILIQTAMQGHFSLRFIHKQPYEFTNFY